MHVGRSDGRVHAVKAYLDELAPRLRLHARVQ